MQRSQKTVPSVLSQKVGASGVKSLSPLALCAFLGVFAKLRKATISFVVSVCPSVSHSVRLSAWKKTRLSLDVFSLNLTHEYFSKICGEN
jgi:hypothetical protein